MFLLRVSSSIIGPPHKDLTISSVAWEWLELTYECLYWVKANGVRRDLGRVAGAFFIFLTTMHQMNLRKNTNKKQQQLSLSDMT